MSTECEWVQRPSEPKKSESVNTPTLLWCVESRPNLNQNLSQTKIFSSLLVDPLDIEPPRARSEVIVRPCTRWPCFKRFDDPASSHTGNSSDSISVSVL